MTVSVLKLGNAIEIERTNIDSLRSKINERFDTIMAHLDTQHSQATAQANSLAALRETVQGVKFACDEELDNQYEALRVIVEGEA